MELAKLPASEGASFAALDDPAIGATPPKISDSGKVLFKIQVTVRDATPASETEGTLWSRRPARPPGTARATASRPS